MKTNMDCNSCGGQHICCSQVVRVTPIEKQRLGLHKNMDFMNLGFTLCQFFKDGRCTVYAKRPRACIDFDCCRPGQLTHSDDTPLEIRKKMGRGLKPEHWLTAVMQKRKELKHGAKEVIQETPAKV